MSCKSLAAFAFAFTLTGCPPPAPPEPPRPPDPTPAPEACEAACAKWQELGCPEGEPTSGGTSCVDVCRNVEESGVLSLDPICVKNATSCEAARKCNP